MIEMSWYLWGALAAICVGAGFVGALLGLGGGFIIVPALTLVFGLDLRSAVGAALIAVIATSSGSSVTYLKQSYSNLELASFLEISTVLGAIASVFVAGYIPASILYFGFSGMLIFSSVMMIKKNLNANDDSKVPYTPPSSRSQKRMSFPQIHGSFVDHHGALIEYDVQKPWAGFFVAGIAGLLSGLLGVGGGVIKVPAMNLLMGVPIKAASATSNLMVGMTAATTAILMFSRHEIPLQISAVVAIGVYLGARMGSKQLIGSSSKALSWVFMIFAWFIAFQMFSKGLHA